MAKTGKTDAAKTDIIAGRGRAVSRARAALYVAGGVVFVVVAFMIFAWADETFHLGFG